MTRSITRWGLRTGLAVVEVMPAAVPADGIDLRAEDLRVDFYRTRGPACTGPIPGPDGVRITHLPTGIVVTAGRGPTQEQNRVAAIAVLEARLLALRMRANEPAGADPAGTDEVRSYVLHPHPMVKDPRTGAGSGDPIGVLDGDIGAFIAAARREIHDRPS